MKVLITGAGVIGLATAWRLASAGATVHILDPRPPGGGASHAALGALWPPSPLATGPLQTLHRASLKEFEAFARTIEEASFLPISYRQLGRIEILHGPKEVDRARLEAAADITLTVIDSKEARSLNPGLAPLSDHALMCDATAQVKVGELIAALAEACRRAGVIFHEATAATGIHCSADRVTGIETSAGAMHADAYLITAGAWTPLLSPLLAAVAPIVPAKGQGIAVPMPSPFPIHTIIKDDSIYLIPWDHEILIGSTTEPKAQFDETPTDSARRTLLTGAAAILPVLHNTTVLRHWAGLRPKSPIKPYLPIMGPHPTFPNLYLCAGHYKVGIGISPLASRLMAESILQRTIPATLTPFLPRRVVAG